MRSAIRQAFTFWSSTRYTPGHHLMLLRRAGEGAPPAGKPFLTAREREVLQLLAWGLSAREIANQLELSVTTVRTHVQNASTRLGARTRASATVQALARGEIDP
jgi:DNA-binding NarL/FixJ family response regulator